MAHQQHHCGIARCDGDPGTCVACRKPDFTSERECLRSIARAMMFYDRAAPDWPQVRDAFLYLVYGGDYGFSRL